MAEQKDYYCMGNCMSYCDDCRWRHRWDEIGELPMVERKLAYPNAIWLKSDACQLSSGCNFRPAVTPQ